MTIIVFFILDLIYEGLAMTCAEKRKEENVLQQQTPNPACLASFVDPLLIPLD